MLSSMMMMQTKKRDEEEPEKEPEDVALPPEPEDWEYGVENNGDDGLAAEEY